jgi:outer membrane protein insertion porin family
MPRFPIGVLPVLAMCVFCARGADLASPQTPKIVSSVEIFGGNARAPLETQAGQTLDQQKLRNDVRSLWRSGRYSDIRVESIDEGDAVRIRFRTVLKRALTVRNVKVVPPTPGIDVQVQPGSEIDGLRANQIADTVRRRLESEGYTYATVVPKLVPAGTGRADLEVRIDRGQLLKIEGVSITGESGAEAEAARKALRWTNSKMMLPPVPGIWKGWRVTPDYTEGAVQNEVLNLRSFYYSRGFFDAKVRASTEEHAGGKVRISYDVRSGPRYTVRQFNLLAAGGPRQIPAQRGGVFPVRDLCKALLAERRQAEKQGVLDFTANIEVRDLPADPGKDGPKVADLTASIQRGTAYRIGRIDFRGSHKIGDTTVRRAMLMDEGAPLDQILLRKSLARLNSTGLFDSLSEANVAINTPPGSNRADLVIQLKDKKSRQWFVSGPVGPMSFAGPLHLAVGTRLPAWGQNLLELSTYSVSMNFMVFAKPLGQLIPGLSYGRYMTALTIQRPALPGQRFLSGFVIAPQLGWEGMLVGYGISQTRGALGGLFESERAYIPPLPVTLSHARAEGSAQNLEGAISCEQRKTKMDWTLQIGGLVSKVAFSFAPF